MRLLNVCFDSLSCGAWIWYECFGMTEIYLTHLSMTNVHTYEAHQQILLYSNRKEHFMRFAAYMNSLTINVCALLSTWAINLSLGGMSFDRVFDDEPKQQETQAIKNIKTTNNNKKTSVTDNSITIRHHEQLHHWFVYTRPKKKSSKHKRHMIEVYRSFPPNIYHSDQMRASNTIA